MKRLERMEVEDDGGESAGKSQYPEWHAAGMEPLVV